MRTVRRLVSCGANVALALITALVMAGCSDQGIVAPGDPNDSLDEATAQALAASVVEASDARLPHFPSLIQAARQAIAANDHNAEAVGAFRKAQRARIAAAEAHLAGNETEAERLRRLSYRFALVGITAALGPEVATEALAGVDAAIARWDAHLAGRDVPARFARALEKARASAEAARAQDSPVAALAHALHSAEVIRSLSPPHLARRALGHAREAFRTARQSVGDSATDAEVQTLRNAHRLLGLAAEAFEGKEWHRAIRAALASADLSQGVIDGRGD